MKKFTILLALISGTMVFAQETKIDQEQTETVITKEYVTDSKGTDVVTKKKTITEKQDIALVGVKNVTPVDTNFNYTMTPTEVNTETTYYNNGRAFRFTADEDRYSLMSLTEDDNMSAYATLKPTSQKGYYILTENGTSKFGFFNENGNFVVESYDPSSDSVVVTVYSINVTPKATMTKKKM